MVREEGPPIKACVPSYHEGVFKLLIVTDRLQVHKIPADVVASLVGHLGNALTRYVQEKEDKRDPSV